MKQAELVIGIELCFPLVVYATLAAAPTMVARSLADSMKSRSSGTLASLGADRRMASIPLAERTEPSGSTSMITGIPIIARSKP